MFLLYDTSRFFDQPTNKGSEVKKGEIGGILRNMAESADLLLLGNVQVCNKCSLCERIAEM